MIRLNRVACGIVAGTAGIIAAAVSLSFTSRASPSVRTRVFGAVFIVVAGGVFALADRLGVLAAPYESERRDVLKLDTGAQKTKRPDPPRRRTPDR